MDAFVIVLTIDENDKRHLVMHKMFSNVTYEAVADAMSDMSESLEGDDPQRKARLN